MQKEDRGQIDWRRRHTARHRCQKTHSPLEKMFAFFNRKHICRMPWVEFLLHVSLSQFIGGLNTRVVKRFQWQHVMSACNL